MPNTSVSVLTFRKHNFSLAVSFVFAHPGWKSNTITLKKGVYSLSTTPSIITFLAG